MSNTMDGTSRSVENLSPLPTSFNPTTSHIRIANMLEMIYKVLQICAIGLVIYVRRNIPLSHPLKMFLVLYLGLNCARTLSLASRIKSNIIFEFSAYTRDNAGFETYESVIDMILFVLYFRGLDLIQICDNCSKEEKLLYYATKSIIIFELFLFLFPIILVCILIIWLAHRTEVQIENSVPLGTP